MSDLMVECKLRGAILFLYNQSVDEPIDLNDKTNEELLDILIEITGAMQQVINDNELTYIDKVKTSSQINLEFVEEYTKKEHQDIINLTESLVFSRFTEEELNARLSKDFDCEVKVSKYEREDCVKRDMPNLDDQLICEITSQKIDLDIYYFIDNGNRYYITEVCFNYH